MRLKNPSIRSTQEPTSNRIIQVLVAQLKECRKTRNLEKGKQVHAEAVECGHHSSIYVASTLISMYARCGSMKDAREIFDSMAHPDVVSWTSLILGYADNGQGLAALDLFEKMKTRGHVPDSVTFVAALKACTSLAAKGECGWEECTRRGKEMHDRAIEIGFDSNIFVQNTLIDMYAKCGSMLWARHVFDSMQNPDVVSWNALIMGYADNGKGYTALSLFRRMKLGNTALNSVTLLAALKACTSLAVEGASVSECREWAKEVHDQIIKDGFDSDIYLQNTLIDMYAKCASMGNALRVFNIIKHPNVVSWTVMIMGYADNGQGLKSLDFFRRMKVKGPAPDLVTFVAVLKACGLVGELEFGRTIHSEIRIRSSHLDIVLVNCLVDFYAKCGSLVEAQRVFDLHTETRTIITWTALLAGFSSCGDFNSAFKLFEKMQDEGIQPESVTFISILACCSHAGLVEKGKECFDTMSRKYGIIPTIDHYTCMVDILGRANKLDAAMALLKQMPCSPDDVTWTTVLCACRKWKNVVLGRLAFQSFICSNDWDVAGYVLMGQIYGSRGMLQEQELVMGMLKGWKMDKLSQRIQPSQFFFYTISQPTCKTS